MCYQASAVGIVLACRPGIQSGSCRQPSTSGTKMLLPNAGSRQLRMPVALLAGIVGVRPGCQLMPSGGSGSHVRPPACTAPAQRGPYRAGLGITIFGMAYMFVHDGLVHRRFPVGPIAEVPALKRIAVAHKLHHAERYQGVPWGLFLGPQELEAVGAKAELDRLCRDLDLSK